ncbi:hypothetical protein L6164_019151 [Bauhinia variegata]|uniref:Uncharacterized protein n=1 Tax=Bauhinia variegata TaxID=167791 RepID=A0ACB9NEK4_BAUVA|nr:hypothetical protein L6164_019151 [Bauhinia variegata]
MWAAPMNDNVVGGRGLVDPNPLFSERLNTDVVNRGQGSGSSAEDDARFSKVTEDGKSGVRGLIQVHESLRTSPQPPVGPSIHWEKFLPLRSIKVLLVEDDDSTRHVVGALLRNCSYEVTAVLDGLQAWQILEDPSNHIDLILTEVAMPFLCGMGLLCKIMSHKTLKNIPVIMMSSHDSMGIVFKCLSKGAADFLVKPIRRNELKNLWQHVWRRYKCNSYSGSGSESGTHTRKSAKSRSNDASENGSDNSNENDFANIGLSLRDGSDNGSGTQSSWTKFPVEVGSPLPISPHKLLVDATDSTCAQVMHTKPEKVSSRWVHATENECHGQNDQLGDVGMGKDLGVGHQFEELSTHSTGKRIYKMSDAQGKKLNRGHDIVCEKGQLVYNSDKIRTRKAQAMYVVDAITDSSNPRAESRELNNPDGLSGISQTKASCCSKPHPSLELTLKRLGGVGDDKTAAVDERNVLRHSDLSAFSRYNTVSSANQVQTGNVGSCSPLANSSVGLYTETASNFPCHSHGTSPNQQSYGSNNINDMGSTNIYLSTKLDAFDKKPESVTGIESFNSSALQTVQNSSISSPQQIISVKAENAEMLKAQVGGSEQGFQVKCNHWSAESKAGNCNVDRRAVESDHGSNGQNGSGSTLTTRVIINVESGNGAAGSVGIGDADRKNSGNRADEGQISLREAALTKFRQKRKERRFDKRVRYYSRKKLAEQRPRIRGQFARSTVSDKREEKDIRNDNSSDGPP